MNPKQLGIGAILLSIATMLGALGAHALEDHLLSSQLDSFKTGVLYLLLNAVALMATHNSLGKLWFRIILVGVLVFSFSIFFLACKQLLGLPTVVVGILGPITPLGGLALIVGWMGFGIQMLKKS